MRVLFLGGTLFTGVHAVRRLVEWGHEVVVFHRGESDGGVPHGVRHLHGDVADLATRAEELRALKPDVVVDMLAFRREDAERVRLFKGIAERTVVISSADVYRAFGRIWRTEPGPPDPTPLTEDSPLREQLSVDGLAYDKTGVEQALGAEDAPAVTILRYPAVHGPNDRAHRTFKYVKRMKDDRPAILLDETIAGWRWVRGYVENVGHATAMAVVDPRAAGRIYNVADPVPHTEAEWVRALGSAYGWKGELIAAPGSVLPPPLRVDNDTTQDYAVDSSRIRAELGYAEPVTDAEALSRTVEWEAANPPGSTDPDEFDYDAEDRALRDLGF